MTGLFEDIIGEIPNDVNRFVNKAMDIADQIVAILKAKDWNQKKLADLLGKRESEISKWLSGTHNFTLETISKIEAVLGEDIIVTPMYLSEYKGMYSPVTNTFIVETNPDNFNSKMYQFTDYGLAGSSNVSDRSPKLDFNDFTNKKLNSLGGQKISGQNSTRIIKGSQPDSIKIAECI